MNERDNLIKHFINGRVNTLFMGVVLELVLVWIMVVSGFMIPSIIFTIIVICIWTLVLIWLLVDMKKQINILLNLGVEDDEA